MKSLAVWRDFFVMKDFREILGTDSVYVFDGAMGTRLYDKGVYINRQVR